MRLAVTSWPNFTLNLPFGISLKIELPPPTTTPVETTWRAHRRFRRVQEVADEAIAALQEHDLTHAIDRLLALAAEFPEDREHALDLAYRARSIEDEERVLPLELWNERRTSVLQEILDALARYRSQADADLHDWQPTSDFRSAEGVESSVSQGDLTIYAGGPVHVPHAVACSDVGWSAPAGPRTARRRILDGVTFAAEPGSIVGVVGRNGAGKTTLLRLLAAEITPQTGQITYPDLVARHYRLRRLRDRVMYVPQVPRPFPGRLRSHLRRAGALRGARGSELDDEVAFVMARFQLTDLMDLSWAALSGGFRTRVDLARAVLASPDILLLDEPLGPLDFAARDDYLEYLKDIAHSRQGTCVVITSQEVDMLTEVADQVVVLRDDAAAFVGSPATIEDVFVGRVYEFSGTFEEEELRSLCDALPEAQLTSRGVRWVLTTAASLETRDVVRALSDLPGELNYFRVLSGSPRRFMEKAS